MHDARSLSGAALAQALRDSRARTLSLVQDLSDAQWSVPQRAGISPIAWELAHIAWFGEFWTLRGPHRSGADGLLHASRPPRHAGPDALLDSARLPHAARWEAALPSREQVTAMLASQLDASIAAMPSGDDDAALYFHRLVLFHEDMHGEAFAWLRSALGYAAPEWASVPESPARDPLRVRGGMLRIGWPPGRRGFAFDNELPGRELVVQDFEIDAAPMSCGDFLRFVEDDGYANDGWWPGEAGRWRAQARPGAPQRWRRRDGAWEQRWFDRWLPIEPQHTLMHVNAGEAEAWCRWAGRRLPSAAEWEHAASSRSSDFAWGASAWEWTADAFQPYPGFEPGPYRDYSAPWFADHRELRGGAFATHARIHDARYRNFFLPGRADVFAGFRTAALAA
jgi:ergothioneine biosynthesis protein EgtB